MGAVIGLAFRALILSLGRLFLSWKTFAAFLITSILGIVLYNLVNEIFAELLGFVTSKMSEIQGASGIQGAAITLTGISAWFVDTLQLDVQASIAVAFITTKWLIVKIPFLKW